MADGERGELPCSSWVSGLKLAGQDFGALRDDRSHVSSGPPGVAPHGDADIGSRKIFGVCRIIARRQRRPHAQESRSRIGLLKINAFSASQLSKVCLCRRHGSSNCGVPCKLLQSDVGARKIRLSSARMKKSDRDRNLPRLRLHIRF